MAAQYADEIIVLSQKEKEYFIQKYNRETHFIPNGVNRPIRRKSNIIKDKWNLEKDSYFLFLGRIVPEKGVHYLIDAYNNLNTDKKLVIAGGASHTNEYLEEIKNKIKDNENIIMTGFVQGEILDELYSNCFLYCLPSDLEGMPISLMEAMSYGANVITSDIDECVQVTGEYGQSFKKGNTEDLRDKINICLKAENRKNSEEISDYILNKYNWDEITKMTFDVYKKKEG